MIKVMACVVISTVTLGLNTVIAQECKLETKDIFVPQNKNVGLVRNADLATTANFILFKTGLRVNTDGAPISYHPNDPRGTSLAINSIVNGVSIKKPGTSLTYGQKIAAFEQFRDAGWKAPAGYKINWQNVIAPKSLDGVKIPCVFTSGPNKGYFGSLTTLKNGLSGSAAGECEVNNQLDQRTIPGLVFPSGNNPLKRFKASIGDLAIAMNPATGKVVTAVVADGGPPENLGEGSVAMNMALLGKTTQPTNYQEAKLLDTGSQRMIVAIIPRSGSFEPMLPYSTANIQMRVSKWASDNGYMSLSGLTAAMTGCAGKL